MSSLCFASICKHIYARGAFGPFHRPARASICWMPFAALRKQSCIQLARPSWTRLRAATVAAVAFGGFVWGRKSGHDKDAYFGKLLDEITTQGAWTALCEAEPRDVRHHFRYFIADAVEKAAASVVKISCVKDDQWYSFQTSGSGFIFEPSAILTNAHVVEGARKVNITLRDGTQLVGQVENLDSLADVAIVRIDGQGKQLPAATLGRSSNLRVGEWIVAMGSPGGNLKDTVTVGIVSALLRQSTDLGMSGRRMVYIQTDCAINQGNSGGPIINIDGEVVAMSTMKAAQLDGVGFAIPIDVAMDMVWQMRQFGRVLRPYLGFKMVTLRPSVLAELRHTVTGFPLELKRGVLIAQVLPGSPAAKAGLLPGDVVVEFDNVPVVESVQVHNQLGDKVGRRVPLRVVRIHDGKARLMDFTVVTEAAQ